VITRLFGALLEWCERALVPIDADHDSLTGWTAASTDWQ
jgi:hypothetical protein